MTIRVRLTAVMALVLAFAGGCGLAWAAEQEETIFTKVTPYTTIFIKKSKEGLLTLWTSGSKYSESTVKLGDPDYVEYDYTQAMSVVLALATEPQRALIVGLGGGTLPSFFRKHYPGMVIDTVDIDPDVVDAAKKLLGFREDAGMHAYVEDGRQFIENSKAPYDIIILDAYNGDEIPYHLVTKEFLQAVRRATAPTGIVAANILWAADNRLRDDMVRTYQEVFDSVYVVAIKDGPNEIVLAMPAKTPLEQVSLARRATNFSRDQKLQFDIGYYIRSGFREPSPKLSAARVLLDEDKKLLPAK